MAIVAIEGLEISRAAEVVVEEAPTTTTGQTTEVNIMAAAAAVAQMEGEAVSTKATKIGMQTDQILHQIISTDTTTTIMAIKIAAGLATTTTGTLSRSKLVKISTDLLVKIAEAPPAAKKTGTTEPLSPPIQERLNNTTIDSTTQIRRRPLLRRSRRPS